MKKSVQLQLKRLFFEKKSEGKQNKKYKGQRKKENYRGFKKGKNEEKEVKEVYYVVTRIAR